MSFETVSRRYAVALADVVGKSGDIETVRSELQAWDKLIGGNAQLKSAFANPSIAHSSKESVLEGVIAKTKPSKTTANFLRVLLRNGRLTHLGEVVRRFEAVLEERSGVISGEVSSARELTDVQRNELRVNLEKRTGKQVRPQFAVDPALIGGVVTRVGSTIYDGSVRTQLENLREQLIDS
jgi:F-type H+-transporting ATPase subunit delta